MNKFMKKVASVALGTALMCSVAVQANAHTIEAIDTNVMTKTYQDAELIDVHYSWGGNDHPCCYFEERNTIQDGLSHAGILPKHHVVKEGPIGAIKPVGVSKTVTNYHAHYIGWLECIWEK